LDISSVFRVGCDWNRLDDILPHGYLRNSLDINIFGDIRQSFLLLVFGQDSFEYDQSKTGGKRR
jgi:hypothetical protein